MCKKREKVKEARKKKTNKEVQFKIRDLSQISSAEV
jgi:hypothetical protein